MTLENQHQITPEKHILIQKYSSGPVYYNLYCNPLSAYTETPR